MHYSTQLFTSTSKKRSLDMLSSIACLHEMRFNVPVSKFPVMLGLSHGFLGIKHYAWELMCLAQEHNRSENGTPEWGSNSGTHSYESGALPPISSHMTNICRSTISHVQFVFDYGDSIRQEVTGFQLSEMYVDMTMAAKENHIYTEGMFIRLRKKKRSILEYYVYV